MLDILPAGTSTANPSDLVHFHRACDIDKTCRKVLGSHNVPRHLLVDILDRATEKTVTNLRNMLDRYKAKAAELDEDDKESRRSLGRKFIEAAFASVARKGASAKVAFGASALPASTRTLGSSWAHRGALWGRPGPLLGLSWSTLRILLEPYCGYLQALLRPQRPIL